MSTITKEWLRQKIAEMESVRDEIPFGLDEDDSNTLAALRIALASLEAEAVADVVAWSSPNEERTCDVRLHRHDIKPGPLYTAPLAPVSVPDEMTMQKALSAIDQLSWQECTRDAYMLGWNACRAAMLQGADGNSTVIPAQPLAWKVIFTMHGQPGSNFKKIFENELEMESAISLHRSGGFDVQVIPLIAHPNK